MAHGREKNIFGAAGGFGIIARLRQTGRAGENLRFKLVTVLSKLGFGMFALGDIYAGSSLNVL